MTWLDKAFERVRSSKQMQYLISNGFEGTKFNDLCYEDRIENCTKPIIERLNNIYSDFDELDDALDNLNEALVTYKDVFTEIGIKLGAQLLLTLLQKDTQTE